MSNAMEKAGAQVFSVNYADGEWYVWCRCESDEMMDEAVRIFLDDWSEFRKAQKKMASENALSKRRKPRAKD